MINELQTLQAELKVYKQLYEELLNKYTELKHKNDRREGEIRYLSSRVNDIELFLNDDCKTIDTLDDYVRELQYKKDLANYNL